MSSNWDLMDVPEKDPFISSSSRIRKGPMVFIVTLSITVFGILIVNPPSTAALVYYFVLWSLFIIVFHKKDYRNFALAFMINSSFIAIYYMIQTSVYPSSYGTTSPLGSWTDDSYFFSLVADRVPAGLELRQDYELYSAPFATIIRALSVLPIYHPMDVIFFQSGIAATLSTFLRRYVIQTAGDERLADSAYVFATVCPFLMMNGGVILIRDTAAAALFIYALCFSNARSWPLALGANVLQIVIRPGTALILIPAYFILLFPNLREIDARRAALLFIGLPLLIIGGALIGTVFLDLNNYRGLIDSVTLNGRQVYDDFLLDPNSNQIFLAIQNMPFLIKFVLNGVYMFLYPFLNMRYAFPTSLFDARAIMMNLFLPIEDFWLNAWFIAGAMTRPKAAKEQTQIVLAVIVTLLVLGTYSLQTRHKTIIYPLYYFVVAIGFGKSGPSERRIGYAISGVFIALQFVSVLR